jgi:hypothetical protein
LPSLSSAGVIHDRCGRLPLTLVRALLGWLDFKIEIRCRSGNPKRIHQANRRGRKGINLP